MSIPEQEIRRPARTPRRTGRALAITVGALTLLAGAVAWLALRQPGQSSAVVPATRTARVPVIIYLIDTLRADRLQAYGYARPTSPVIDELARQSVVFGNAMAASPWTLPSVASLVTSTFACEHGVVRAGLSLDPALPTLAQRLQAAGYATAALYANVYAGPTAALDRGYQVSRYFNDRVPHDREAREFLATVGQEPFFLYLHTMEPHQAYLTDYRYTRPFGHVSIETKASIEEDWNRYTSLRIQDFEARRPPGSTDNTAEQRQLIARFDAARPAMDAMYDGAVREADESLGRIIALLKAEDVWDRALFILVADHGEEFGEHGVWFHEQSVYQSVMHVPMIVHFPRGEFGGRRVDTVVSLVDVAPTVLDYLDAGPCDGCEGASLLPLATGAATQLERGPVPALRINRTSYYRPYKESRGDINVVMRRDPWKAIWNPEPGKLELYDLARDPEERQDQAGARPEIASEMRAAATTWLRECDARIKEPAKVEVDLRVRDKLHALGYAH